MTPGAEVILTDARRGPRNGRGRVERYHQIRVGRLQRLGLLEPLEAEGPAQRFELSAPPGLSQVGVLAKPYPRGLWLSFYASPAPEPSFALVERTPCPLGGARAWLVCPDPGCGRRCAALFVDGRRVACRRCLGLAYGSQSRHYRRAAPPAPKPSAQTVSAGEGAA